MNAQNHLAVDGYSAALVTASHARDKDDLADLLGALGLLGDKDDLARRLPHIPSPDDSTTGDTMPADALTPSDQFTRRTADVTAQLAAHGIPLTAPAAPPADTDDPWVSSHPVPVDRSTLAWCTAVTMLANHHRTTLDRQVPAADALLRELGVRGLATLHSDLNAGAPVDYHFTRCPYCSGIGEDPTRPTCQDLGCAPWHEFDGHEHLCPVCRGDNYQPQWFAEEHMAELEELLADAIEKKAPSRSRLRAWRRCRETRS